VPTEDGDATSTADERPGAGARAVWTGPRAIATAAGGVALAAGLVLAAGVLPDPDLLTLAGRGVSAAELFFLLAVALAGPPTIRAGLASLRTRTLDVPLLMTIAIAGAILATALFRRSLLFEAATVAVLFGVAELLEDAAMVRARSSLADLVDRTPDTARIRDGEAEREVPTTAVEAGDVVVVRPGDRIPVDGTVVEGESAVDQSPVTGESVPVDKTVGDEVFAGTILANGFLAVEATAPASESTLAQVIERVTDAEAARTDREQFVDRFASVYTPIVVAAAVLLMFGPPLLLDAPWPRHVRYGLTLLVLACPCAFVIATPVSVVSAITGAARAGVLIDGGDRLEAMGDVGCVALDKTGTLTTGDLQVTDVIPLEGATEADVLRCARGVERRSDHPIGEAIVAHAEDRGGAAVDDRAVSDFERIAGTGVRATLDGTEYLAGKPAAFADLDVDLGHVHAATDHGAVSRTARDLCERNDCVDLLDDLVPQLEDQGKTVVLVGTRDRLEGVIAVRDAIRPEAAAAVEALHDRGLDTVLLTGDNERTARAVAADVGIDDVRAGMLPGDKVDAITEIEAAGRRVAMVGDGVNDAPALAAATVGIAMGAAGSDAAIETADVALLGDDLSALPRLYDLARRAGGVIRTNVWASLGVKALLALGVPFGLVPIWLAVLAGDAGMTVAITGNAMRLAEFPSGE
jgi:Cd2+/Zn2+-exporting ATPase